MLSSMNYSILDITDVECIGEFEDEYVYDLEMDDDTNHTFFANDILVHNSLYLTFNELDLPFINEKGECTPEAFVISDECETFINTHIKNWALSELNSLDSRLEFKREAIIDRGLFLNAKKRYICHIVNNEGIPCNKYKYVGVELVRTSMHPTIKKMAKEIVEIMIDTRDQLKTDEAIANLYNEFRKLKLSEISSGSGIKDTSRWPEDINDLSLPKGTPMHVRAAYYHNHLCHKLGLQTKYPPVKSGDKIRTIYVKTPNVYGISCIAFKGECPEEFLECLEPDYEAMFDKVVFNMLTSFYTAVNWIARKPNDQIVCNLMDFLKI